MKRHHNTCVFVLIVLSRLFSQIPEPICGLPALTALSPDEPLSLQKRQVPTDNPIFKIREHYAENKLMEVEFYLMYEDPAFRIYAEAQEVDDGRVDVDAVSNLVAAFRDHTFPGSVDTSKGIKAIAEEVFGSPPDIDHNNQVFILLIDVRDDYVPDSSQTYVAGYFDPQDQRMQGNLADIIYLDTNPGNVVGPQSTTVLSTLAHEYQHLIHYGHDTMEELWVNEGLSELSPILMGLPGRDYSSFLANTNVQLDAFEGEVADYARSGLFFRYAWIQTGTPFIQALIRSAARGLSGVDHTLSQVEPRSIDEFIFDWHAANYLQSDGIYGYAGHFTMPRPEVHDVIVGFPEDDFQRNVTRLGAHWTLISGGSDLYLFASRQSTQPAVTLINADENMVLPSPGLFTTGYEDSAFGESYHDLIVLASSSTAVTDYASYSLFASAVGGYEVFTLSYDGDEEPQDVTFISLGDGELSGAAAVSFNLPDRAEPSSIQFMALTNDSVEVKLYDEPLQAQTVIYQQVVRSPLGTDWTTHRLPEGFVHRGGQVFASVSSISNALAYNEHLPTSYSHYMPPGEAAFSPLPLFSTNGDPLTGNWSIRLTYLMSDTMNEPLKIPLIVGQFYPNPVLNFPLITLPISPGHGVELTLYNLLGQQVRRLNRSASSYDPILWDGNMTNGMPAPSGIYLARIVSGRRMVSRKLVLIR
ncbi:MAG: T9SS type A sorting domain-containing protein [Fidelibacterota bacterium]|nr:MAG: T9SS type A sorting domain-containing protein [Candidatus Neomarinimicrobiota bacterium]